MDSYDLIVVGGGASGLMAAGIAAQKGANVLLLEKMFRPGRKLRITGKGRCNITNLTDVDDFLTHVGPNPEFLRPAFEEFFAEDLIRFFNSINIRTKTERGRRVFPKSDKAQDIVDGLTNWVRNMGVKTQSNVRINKLILSDGKFKAIKSDKGKLFFAKKLILCTGGASYPATGSTGDGYRILEKQGHQINKVRPSLVPLKVDFPYLKELDRLSLRNIRIKVYKKDELVCEKFGEMQFLSNSISGPLILTLSRELGDELSIGGEFRFEIDLKPALSETKISNRIKREVESEPSLRLKSLLRKLLPSQLINVFIKELNLSTDKRVADYSEEECLKVIQLLKSFSFNVIGLRDFDEAIITAGGLNLDEVNPQTMESKLIKNLYFAGELLDVDADTGGYNLQIAFSTGRLAGLSATK